MLKTLITLPRVEINVRNKPKGKSSMDNPAISNIGYTRHTMKTNKTKNTTQKTKNMSNTNREKMPGVNTGDREG